MECIRVAGIHNKRADFLIDLAAVCVEKYGGDIPLEFNDILAFQGIARKTAMLYVNECIGLAEGIGTDVHVMEWST